MHVEPSPGREITEAVYNELRRLAGAWLRDQPPGHTLQPTAIVHEAYIRLAERGRGVWNDERHFTAATAKAMRQVLVDHARARQAAKRGGGRERRRLDVSLMADGGLPIDDILAIDEALERLARLDPRQARIVELRYFAGLTVDEIAAVIGASPRTVDLDWRIARGWLATFLGEG